MEEEDGAIYDTVQLSDMEFQDSVFYYPCPCGDLFEISLTDVLNGGRIATCPTCSLKIGVRVSLEELNHACSILSIPSEAHIYLNSGIETL